MMVVMVRYVKWFVLQDEVVYKLVFLFGVCGVVIESMLVCVVFEE